MRKIKYIQGWDIKNIEKIISTTIYFKFLLKVKMNTIESNTTINELDIEVGHPVDRGNERYLWFCCSNHTTDKRIIIYFTQFSISLIIIFFCIFQLLNHNDCESNQLYMGLLTLIIGVYLPSPKLRKN